MLDAQNNYQASLSMLSQVLGYPSQQQFDLVDTDTAITPPSDSASQLEDEAFGNRPEIAAQNYEFQAAQHFQKAERDLLFPTIEALGVVGKTPAGSSYNNAPAFVPNWYGAVGVNVAVPIFNGFLYPAQSTRSFAARAGGQRAVARSERPNRQRCPHQLVECRSLPTTASR